MNYELVMASEEDIQKLIEYKLDSILEYAVDLEDGEINRIKSYVYTSIPRQLNQYKIIKLDDKQIGCLLVEEKDDGVLLDEIYIEQAYRNRGIGTQILHRILEDNIVYLWVYKLNTKAIALYKRLGFCVVEQTESRYYMRCNK